MFFQVPVTAVAKHYKVLGEIGRPATNIPAWNTRAALNKRVHLHANGATGALKFLGGPIAGSALAVGPQAFLDYSASDTATEFYNKSVDSQPTNIISAAVGIGAGYALGGMATAAMIPAAPLIVVLAVGWIAGLGAQWAIINTGLDKKIGNALKIENEK